MRAVCLIGSPHSNGSSAFIIDKIIEGMKENNIEVSRYCLGDMHINYCLGCKKCCQDNGRCIQNDVQEHI